MVRQSAGNFQPARTAPLQEGPVVPCGGDQNVRTQSADMRHFGHELPFQITLAGLRYATEIQHLQLVTIAVVKPDRATGRLPPGRIRMRPDVLRVMGAYASVQKISYRAFNLTALGCARWYQHLI